MSLTNLMEFKKEVKVKATELKRKYPEVWSSVEAAIIEDMRQCMPQAMIEMSLADDTKDCRIHRVAHNAAFMATSELHKTRTRKGWMEK